MKKNSLPGSLSSILTAVLIMLLLLVTIQPALAGVLSQRAHPNTVRFENISVKDGLVTRKRPGDITGSGRISVVWHPGWAEQIQWI